MVDRRLEGRSLLMGSRAGGGLHGHVSGPVGHMEDEMELRTIGRGNPDFPAVLRLYETMYGYRDLGRKSRYRKNRIGEPKPNLQSLYGQRLSTCLVYQGIVRFCPLASVELHVTQAAPVHTSLRPSSTIRL